VHIARILRRAGAEIDAADVPPIGEVWARVSDYCCRITMHATFVEKHLEEFDCGRVQWYGEGGLHELYDLIDEGKVVGTVKLQNFLRITSESTGKDVPIGVTLFLKPLGYRVVPLLREFRDFLMDVLVALHSMHVNGWVHRDIKRSNVVKLPNEHWILIDLEYGARLDETGSADWPWFDCDDYPMPKRNGDERWRPEHDVKQVAIMLEGLDSFKQHPQRSQILNILQTSSTANVVDQLVPLLD